MKMSKHSPNPGAWSKHLGLNIFVLEILKDVNSCAIQIPAAVAQSSFTKLLRLAGEFGQFLDFDNTDNLIDISLKLQQSRVTPITLYLLPKDLADFSDPCIDFLAVCPFASVTTWIDRLVAWMESNFS